MKLPSRAARRALALALAPCLLLAGCISVDIASQTAPEFRGHLFLRTLVVADVGMLHERTLAEDLIVKRLTSRRVDALRSLDVVFGADTLPEEAFLQHAAEAGADAVLILRVREEGELSRYFPTSTDSTFYSEQDGVLVGQTSTHAYGTAIHPWATFRATLIETATGRTAWFADATADGTSSSSSGDLVKSVSEKVVERLVADGILKVEQRR